MRPVPSEPKLLDAAYSEKLQQGERETIRLALTLPQDTLIIIDDRQAFIVANRFGVKPHLLLDVLILLSQQFGLPKSVALAMTLAAARRYPPSYVLHTVLALNELE